MPQAVHSAGESSAKRPNTSVAALHMKCENT